MADLAHVWTDRKIDKMEKELEEIYRRADKELTDIAEKYFSRFNDADEKKRALMDSGEITVREYKMWRRSAMMTGKHWEEMKRQASEHLLRVNETATRYVNDQLASIYARNYNQVAGGLNGEIKGYSFEMVDASTVRRLSTDNETLLPYKYIDGKKDVRWNTQKVNSEVLQGIIQGDSIPNLAKRLERVAGMNRASAIRNARTSATSAENKGRMDMLHDAEDKGIHTKKVWLATMDNRTRDAHRELDGEAVDVDDYFDNEFGKILFPGDPDADPENVYNCRCTLTYEVVSINGNMVGEEDEVPIDETNGQEQAQNVVRNYNNDVASEMGRENYDKYIDQLDACQYPDVKEMYEKNMDQVGVDNFGKNAPGQCSGTRISLDVERDVNGSPSREPYSVFYHEAGHANDHILGKEIGDRYYSTGWNNGEYSRTIKEEVNQWVSSVDKQLKQEFNEHKTDLEWLKEHHFITLWDESGLKRYADSKGISVDDILSGSYKDGNTKYLVPKYSKSKAYKLIEDQITKDKRTDPDWDFKYSDLSDILEGATSGKIQCGWGHGKTYWTYTDVGVEAFAEMSQAHVCNPKSLEILEQYLPKSVDTYRRMIADAGGL